MSSVFDLEQINIGLLLDGRKPIQEYTPDDFITKDVQKAIQTWQKSGGCKEDIAKILSPRFLNDCHESVERWNGIGDNVDWRSALLQAKANYTLGRTLHKAADALESNDTIDLLPIYGQMTSALAGQSTGLALANQIDYKHYKPFMPSGYKPIDTVIGGYPSDGPIVAFGSQGTGKSFWGANAVDCLLNAHKAKTAGIYTLEMSAEHYLYRSISMYPSLEKIMDRLYVSGSVRNVEELVAEVTTKRLDFVVIDDMDRIVKSVDPAAYQIAYFRLAEICRFLKIPIMILAQPNRAAKLGDRFLGPYDISWSSAGENSAALLIALQVANTFDIEGDNDIFPLADEDHYYLIFWKSRDGWPVQQGPGAIRLDGANKNKLWSGIPYKNQLFPPVSGKKRKIGGKK